MNKLVTTNIFNKIYICLSFSNINIYKSMTIQTDTLREVHIKPSKPPNKCPPLLETQFHLTPHHDVHSFHFTKRWYRLNGVRSRSVASATPLYCGRDVRFTVILFHSILLTSGTILLRLIFVFQSDS